MFAISKKMKKAVSAIALILILAMVLGTIASALTGCGAAESKSDDVTIRIAGLKGPTTIGLVNFLQDAASESSSINYQFQMFTAGSDIMAAMAAGEADLGLVPSNVACIMNNKVEGGVSIIDINTLGVLACVTVDDSIDDMSDLAGRTVYMTGQGATPEYTVRYLLERAGISDCNLEFKSEPTEIVSLFAEDESAVAILPQPFVTAALAQNDKLKTAFTLDDEWGKYNTDCSIVTGVTVVTNNFLAEHKDAVDAFIKAHKESAEKAVSDPDTTAALVVEQGIIAKEPLAKKAIPSCNIVCITGDEIKSTLKGYLEVLYDQDPKSVGGKLPGDEFYYVGE
jgi:NitT/TauT family transport system substrate-binding protein